MSVELEINILRVQNHSYQLPFSCQTAGCGTYCSQNFTILNENLTIKFCDCLIVFDFFDAFASRSNSKIFFVIFFLDRIVKRYRSGEN